MADVFDRQFSFTLSGAQYRCWYGDPTDRLFRIASITGNAPESRGNALRNLRRFRDYERWRRGEINENTIKSSALYQRMARFFEEMKPLSFFIKSLDKEVSLELDDFEMTARQLNCLMRHFDRSSPLIQIQEDVAEGEEKAPCRYVRESFPAEITTSGIDEVLLALLEVARREDSRFAIVFYYQVFEYASYYYVNEAVRQQLRLFLKDPLVSVVNDERISHLLHIASSLNKDDHQKLKDVVVNNVDPSVLWSDVDHYRDFFAHSHTFDGAFFVKPLIHTDTGHDDWCSMWHPLFIETVKQVRNAIVHTREKRENKVILPTPNNDALLVPIRALIQNAAEQLAFRY